ncbi:DUF6245 family protein [Streptomyces sp. NPDC004539]|uniref:DUF6245 family protein n=1 Tax=Streptomyces sp. NPDC004539 TaxID=3154280 RepID=UPI0033B5A0F0
MAALGLHSGENTPEGHARLDGPDAYRVRTANALLGVVQAEAATADGVKLDEEARHAAWQEQLKAAGASLDDLVRREFIRWQVLRAGTPLRLMAQNREVDTLAAQTGQLEAAHESLQNAIDNADVLLNMLKSVGL